VIVELTMTLTPPLAAIADRAQFRREIVQRADRIPSLPDLILKLLRMIDNERTNALEFERHLASDPTLVAKLMRVVNSPLYGMSRKVTSIRDCVVILGMRGLKSLVLAANTADYLDQNFECYGYVKSGLWMHSVAVASASRSIARATGFSAAAAEEIFIGALLHDIGKVVLGPWLVERKLDLGRHGVVAPPGLLVAEMETIGLDHAEAGDLVAGKWNLGDCARQIILHHHLPSAAATARKECSVVHLADHVADRLRIGMQEGAAPETPLDPEAVQIAGLDGPGFAVLAQGLEVEMRAAVALVTGSA
jgi:HD-like signal output (HDOD) protein